MNLFIFIFRDYRSCLLEIGAIIAKERALMQLAHMILWHTYHVVNSNTLDFFYIILSFII